MRGVICVYSGSGNTRLACQYIVKHVQNVEWDLLDIAKGDSVGLGAYDVVGLATFTDFFGPPHLMYTFVDSLPAQANKPAFVFHTFGNLAGKTLRDLGKLARRKGLSVIAGHSLHTPENYPPMIVGGNANEQAPDEKELRAFDAFVAELDQLCARLAVGEEVSEGSLWIGLLNSLMPRFPRTTSRRDMGKKYVDAELCTECGLCEKKCPYGAITLDPGPIFDVTRCYGCWACFHHCPRKAIYTKKFRGVGHYPKPIPQLREKLQL